MGIYKLTAFKPNGEKVLDENIQAGSDEEAIEVGSQLLEEKQLQESTYRCTSPQGKLVLYQS
ncbi:YhzD family protein [Bacillus sp. B15-48]|uniref:YhzD family protein n=1 Tax=Bacillus sp. B15-48 TaxID=1548601 RepID=UPI00193F61C7|nr:YhzD family protein [Bacillus sp. B15-48]MBM4764154.1 hypothetical protein [Bacillus sp. B15-48]